MALFSKRNQFDPRIAKSPVTEDAPKILRLAYWKRILEPLTYIDQDSRYERAETAIFGRKKLLEDLCVSLYIEPNDSMNDSWGCTDELKSIVIDTPWYQFYDVAERVGQILLESEGMIYFSPYRDNVNTLFEDHLVVWRLNDEGILLRIGLDDLQNKIEQVETVLLEGFPAALEHLRKARCFVSNRPLDPENAIKEAVSAVESYGRTLYPAASTLGDVIKEIRKTAFPKLLLSMMEKFYAFASAAPGVRHGGTTSSQIGLADADFCLYVSIAFIDYVHKLNNR